MKRKKLLTPLTEKQKQAAWLMFNGNRIGTIADQLGVHRTTIWRWHQRRDFQKELGRIRNSWISNMRKEARKRYLNSPEYRMKMAARRRLKLLEKKLEKAGNSGNMRAYVHACAEYNKCFNLAYFSGKTPFQHVNKSRSLTNGKKSRKAKKYIVEII